MPNLAIRPRRLRMNAILRDSIAEAHFSASDLIQPFFITEGQHHAQPIPSMPGIQQLTLDHVLIDINRALGLGINKFMLFGVPEEKDQQATSAYEPFGVIQQATKQIKEVYGTKVLLMTDTCLCEYTSHGHCGIVVNGEILNDPSVETLVKVAISQAESGADVICPSDMMDGRVSAIRQGLDQAGYPDIPILSYAAKYASAFYSPFRDAANSAPAFGDRRSYQMDPRNSREAIKECQIDMEEGADMLMVKPAIGYLDILHQIRQISSLPIVAYNVSGEYSMVKAAAQNGWIDEQKVVLELMTGIKRAGADIIVTYHANDIAQWLQASNIED